ncbi:MAG: DUF4294 domain-containing protein [Bacteroidales bacterium]|nr:DUF4294 domain-containing protein [Bacteroidales bacterium]
MDKRSWMMRLKRWLLVMMGWFCVLTVSAQDEGKRDTVQIPVMLSTTTIGSDTLPLVEMEEVRVIPLPKFRNRRQARRFGRYVRNVKKVYPYAKLTARLLNEMEQHMDSLTTEREKKAYIKQVEKSLKDQYSDVIWNMTFSQGKILIKLIDRETGMTSYEIIDRMKGAFNAGFWQAVARLFGSNLKTKFDPGGEDRILNQVVMMIEYGMI